MGPSRSGPLRGYLSRGEAGSNALACWIETLMQSWTVTVCWLMRGAYAWAAIVCRAACRTSLIWCAEPAGLGGIGIGAEFSGFERRPFWASPAMSARNSESGALRACCACSQTLIYVDPNVRGLIYDAKVRRQTFSDI